jgi:hypothetical protein
MCIMSATRFVTIDQSVDVSGGVVHYRIGAGFQPVRWSASGIVRPDRSAQRPIFFVARMA